MFERVRRWWFQRKVSKRLNKLVAKVTGMHGQLNEMERTLKQQQRQFLQSNKATIAELDKVRGELSDVVVKIEEVQLNQSSHQSENSKLREELDVLRDVSVPGLVAANELMLQRFNRMTAEEVRLQTPMPREVL